MEKDTFCGENYKDMHEADIEEQVKTVLEELALIPVEDLSKELIKDLSLDSLRLVMLLVNLEETFGIELNESDLNPFQLIAVRDVVNLVKKYILGENANE